MGVVAINRYPVKSMLGERLERAVVTVGGIVGDRAYAVVDQTDGKVASAKNPGKWRSLLRCRAAFVEEPSADGPLPPVVVTLPDGAQLGSDDPKVHVTLSELFDREVRLVSSTAQAPVLEEVWPEIDDLAPDQFIEDTRAGTSEDGEPISDIPMAMFAPPGSFFDLATLHLLTTSTLAHLRELEPAGTFDPQRYRPNFLVDVDDPDATGFVENDWVGGQVALGGEARAAIALPTMRCVMTTLAQSHPGGSGAADLPIDRATLRAIARHNKVEIAGFGTWACAGAYATVAASGAVTLGDNVTFQPAS